MSTVAIAAEPPAKTDAIGGTGHIEPRDGVIAISGVPGFTIDKVFVHGGDTVKRGDALVELDSGSIKADAETAALELANRRKNDDFRAKISALAVKSAESNLQWATRQLAAYRALGSGGTAQKELAHLEQGLEDARNALEIEKLKAEQAAFDSLASEGVAEKRLEAFRANAGRFVMRAPSDGTVVRINHHPGETVGGGEPVMEFADLSQMDVIAQVYQGDVLKLRPGMKTTIKSGAVLDLGTGSVVSVGSLIERRTQLGEVRIRLDKPEKARHLIGMEVEVLIGP